MASLIDPRCAVPLFLLENEQTAHECGIIEGYVVSFIITLILVAIGIYIFYANINNKKMWLAIICIIIVFMWIVIPWLNAWLNKRHWLGYDEQIKSYQKSGISRDEAIKKLQDLYQTNIQASAINQSGFMIASALLSRKD